MWCSSTRPRTTTSATRAAFLSRRSRPRGSTSPGPARRQGSDPAVVHRAEVVLPPALQPGGDQARVDDPRDRDEGPRADGLAERGGARVGGEHSLEGGIRVALAGVGAEADVAPGCDEEVLAVREIRIRGHGEANGDLRKRADLLAGPREGERRGARDLGALRRR